MKRYIAWGLVALLFGALVPVSVSYAVDRIDRKQSRQIRSLKRKVRKLNNRVRTIENAPDTTTGLADEIAALRENLQENNARDDNQGELLNLHGNRLDNHDNRLDNLADNINSLSNTLFNRTQWMDGNGEYGGPINQGQLRLSQTEQGNCNLGSNDVIQDAVWNYNGGSPRMDCRSSE